MAKYVIELSEEDIRKIEQATGWAIADADDLEHAIRILVDGVLPE